MFTAGVRSGTLQSLLHARPCLGSHVPNTCTLAAEVLGPGAAHQEAGSSPGQQSQGLRGGKARPDPGLQPGQPQASAVQAARRTDHMSLGPRTTNLPAQRSTMFQPLNWL